jgi:hypothetical protein
MARLYMQNHNQMTIHVHLMRLFVLVLDSMDPIILLEVVQQQVTEIRCMLEYTMQTPNIPMMVVRDLLVINRKP